MPLSLPAQPKGHKYHAIHTVVDGIKFHSRKEANWYCGLLFRLKAGEIRDLELQPEFVLHAPIRNSHEKARVGVYRADFRYREGPQGLLRIEDVKSPATRTALYRWKKRHTEVEYGITITEV